MSDLASDAKQAATTKKPSGSQGRQPVPKTPTGMSTADHTMFIDLLLQRTAEAAKQASATTDPKAQLRTATEAVMHARAALAAYTIPETGTAPKQLLGALDAAFAGLFDLYGSFRNHADATTKGYAPTIAGVMSEMDKQFTPVGWKLPTSADQVHGRGQAAERQGAAVLTISEKGALGRLHLRAARQLILGHWKEVVGGQVGALAVAATANLRDAMAVLVDPHLAAEEVGVADELEATEQVLSRLFMALDGNASALGELTDVARGMDALLGLVGKAPRWVSKASVTGASTTTGAQPSQAPASTGGQGAATTANRNEIDPGPPRAEPAMHRTKEQRHWTKKVHIKDTNYVDEYLGYVELLMEAVKTPSGQIYVERATATKMFEDRAGQYLSVGADIVANSIDLNGQRFCDIYFDVQIGGPNKTETSSVNASLKGSAGTSDRTVGAEGSAGIVFSTAISSQGTRSFRRVYRIAGLSKPTKIMKIDPNHPFEAQLVDTMMVENERRDLHKDFSDFELDDDDVGDTLTSFYANWVLHSYSDDD